MPDVASKIRLTREKNGMTQEQLAQRLGFSISVVQKWEYGKGIPAKKSLKKISQVFRKPVSFFTGNPEDDEVPLVAELEWDALPATGRASMVADGAQVQAYGSVREPGPEEVRKALADLEAALDDMEAAKSRARLAQLVLKRYSLVQSQAPKQVVVYRPQPLDAEQWDKLFGHLLTEEELEQNEFAEPFEREMWLDAARHLGLMPDLEINRAAISQYLQDEEMERAADWVAQNNYDLQRGK